MARVLPRVPLGGAMSWHVLEQGLHSDHSDTWHSLVITQDWKVIGSFSCGQKLQKSISILIRDSQAVRDFVFYTAMKSAWTFLFPLGGAILISLKIYHHL